ncbi:MAG: exodeoxyribonuclease VII small subunit [Clostridia bacterium]|nr:exodeoxyribonuclease VII small subunit [Clostridia bacterium]
MENGRSFESAMSELEKIVARLESGELTLDESIEVFQKGISLSNFCSKRLDEIEKKISILIEDGNGNIIEEDFEEMEG